MKTTFCDRREPERGGVNRGGAGWFQLLLLQRPLLPLLLLVPMVWLSGCKPESESRELGGAAVVPGDVRKEGGRFNAGEGRWSPVAVSGGKSAERSRGGKRDAAAPPDVSWYRSADRLAMLQQGSFTAAMAKGRELMDSGEIPAEELMAFFKSVPDLGRSTELCQELVGKVAVSDAVLALKLAALADPGALPPRLYGGIARAVGPDELAAVMAAARETGWPEVESATRAAIEDRIRSMDLETLVSFSKGDIGADFHATLSDQEAVLTYAQRGLQEADFAGNGDGGSDRGPEFGRVLLSMGIQAKPVDTARWISGHFDQLCESGVLDRSVVADATRSYLGKNPGEAMAWAASLNDRQLSGAAVRAGMDAWLQVNSLAASEWVSAQPAGNARDVAALAVAQHQQRHGDPAAARQWAATVQGAELQAAAAEVLRAAK